MKNKKTVWEVIGQLNKAQILRILGNYLYDGYANYTEDQLRSVIHTLVMSGDVPTHAVFDV